jgi:hypothetical protein
MAGREPLNAANYLSVAKMNIIHKFTSHHINQLHELYCVPDMQNYYEQLGYKSDLDGIVLMQRS